MDEYKFAQMARDILESMSGFVATDKDGRIIYINEQSQKKLGKSQEECIGHPIEEIFPDTRIHFVLRDRKEEICKYIGAGGYLGTEITQSNLLIYRNGDRESGEVTGAMGFLSSVEGKETEYFFHESADPMMGKQQTGTEHSGEGLKELLGQSPKVKEMKNLIRRIANTSVAVCILGETGTGKELVANAIQKLSERSEQPFIKINCAAIPKDLMESELFGYEPGAFTSASRHGKIGKFELANGGTLLLDEIGELPLNLQAKLLRVLQANEVERVGGIAPIPINVRFLCSTNRNLQQMVKAGIFRDDLYYRINVMEVTVPPLRERLDDIPALVEHFIDSANKRHKLSVVGVEKKVEKMLKSYHWPGNIRELEHCIERACVLCGKGYLTREHFSSLPFETVVAAQKAGEKTEERTEERAEGPSFRSQRYDAEAEIIMKAMEASRGNKTEAAKMLHITRATLYSKLKKYNIEM